MINLKIKIMEEIENNIVTSDFSRKLANLMVYRNFC